MVPQTATQARKALAQSLAPAYPDARECAQVVRLLLCHILRMQPHQLALQPAHPLTADEQAALTQAEARLLAHEPLQYVLGTAPFMHLDLAVGPGCLIPRPETEELVHWALTHIPTEAPCRVLDVGTGSGCMALAVQSLRPQATVQGWDLSPEALTWARRNAHQLNLPVTFCQQDLNALDEQPTLLNSWDVILCNPPYVDPTEADTLAARVHDYEPHLALYAPAADALHFYKLLLRHLPAGTTAFLELHTPTAPLLQAWVQTHLPHLSTHWQADLQGRMRMLRAGG